jgi:hypothetical protein
MKPGAVNELLVRLSRRAAPCPRPSVRRPGTTRGSVPRPTSTSLSNASLNTSRKVAGLRTQLADRGDELAAARAANRELMVQLNAAHPR